MTNITVDNFSLKQISESGQCFRMTDMGDGIYQIISSDKRIFAKQEGVKVSFSCDEKEYRSYWYDYFDLGTDYRNYSDKIDPDDEYLNKAADFGSGIRILRQDPWEMIVTFLISQRNNIPRIKKCIELLCRTYGEQRSDSMTEDEAPFIQNKEYAKYYTFPKPEDLTDLDEDALMECNLGYRSKYVVRTARTIADPARAGWLEALKDMPYEEARSELMSLYGVGAKVADCICLFGLQKLEAFPIDTHISQVLDAHYQEGFPKDRYMDFLGVIQQYLFYYDLKGQRSN